MRIIGKVEKSDDLMLGVLAYGIAQITDVMLIQTDNHIIIGILATGYLVCLMSLAIYAVLSKFSASRWIDWLAYFLGTGSRRCNLELICTTNLFHHTAEHILCHRTSANISVAYEHYFLTHTIWRVNLACAIFFLESKWEIN